MNIVFRVSGLGLGIPEGFHLPFHGVQHAWCCNGSHKYDKGTVETCGIHIYINIERCTNHDLLNRSALVRNCSHRFLRIHSCS